MRIIGFGFEKISAQKGKGKDLKIKINSNIDIISVDKDRIENLNEEVLRLHFKFITDFDPDLAKILLEGYILLSTDKAKAKEIMKKWKLKKLPDDVRIPLFNFILTKCNIKALNLEEDINIPTHIPMPKIVPPGQQQENNRSYV